MIRHPLALRLNPDPSRSFSDALRLAAKAGVAGVVLDASGDLAPDALGETGRRDVRHRLRSAELKITALHLPTRRPFDTVEQLDDRVARVDRALSLAFELGANLALLRVGPVPSDTEVDRLTALRTALVELARRSDHRGVRLAVELGPDPSGPLRAMLDGLNLPTLCASIDPGRLRGAERDPASAVVGLGPWLAHAYATETATRPGEPVPEVDWPSYLGALEEVDYRGPLTLWPDPSRDQTAALLALRDRLARA
jgi:sugar phosphate isomerase/epimerase